MERWKRLLLRALVCFAASTVILAAIPVVFGSPIPIVRVVWKGVTPTERLALEREFQLADPIELSDDAWGYTPPDAPPAILRALAQHRAVARVDGFNARTARLDQSLPLSPRRGGWMDGASPWLARVTRLMAYLLILAGVWLLSASALASPFIPVRALRHIERRRRDPRSAIGVAVVRTIAWIQRGVPAATPESVAVFRVVLGSCILWYVTAKPLNIDLIRSPEVETARGIYGAVVRWLADHPAIPANLHVWLSGSGALFIAGVVTPISYACFVAGFLLWACVLTLTTSTHSVASLSIAMVCLLAARWGDALSVDALVRHLRRQPEPHASAQRYGFAIWIPRLVLGVTFLAAAWSKVGNGLDWVLNGTVKYYFVSDLSDALVTWGPRITESHAVAVLMSAAAVIIEASVITAAFSRSAVYVLVLGLASLSLLAGFALFQGVFWWGWWMLAMAFLPWHYVRWPWHRRSPVAARTGGFGLSAAQVAVALVLLVQQSLMSTFRVEARPMLSAYDMYSATYASADDFERATNLIYRVLIVDEGNRLPTTCVLADRDAVLLSPAATGDIMARTRLRSVLRDCLPSESTATALVFEGDRQVYDWHTRQFTWKRAIDVLGPTTMDWLGER